MKKYDPKKIEAKWQKVWDRKKLNTAKSNSHKKKYYVLVEFPYPSGEGLHTGHIRSYTALDVLARKRRAEGFNVLYPMGWDAFGLPTENYAIKTGIHPKIVTKKNTDNFRRQLKSLGFSFDWSREINTTDPKYYKWTQWIFLQFLKNGLAYKAKRPINWCLKCKIGLADEEVVGGACERCGSETEKRDKEQWMLAITKYADRLHKDLDDVDFLEKIKIQQRNWIGRSEGAEISFQLSADSFQEDREIYSYVMGVGVIDDELISIGVKIHKKTQDGSYKITIPKDKIKNYEKLIAKVLKPGFWNEYVDDQVVFIFKNKQGKIDRLVWNETDEANLLNLCNEYAEYNFKSMRSMLEGQDWYSSKLKAKSLKLEAVSVFTTRPDTLFGATYLVLAPEHNLIKNLESRIMNYEEVRKYADDAKRKSEIERTSEGKEKTGIELKGIKAINPANKEEIPVYVADYVLGHYGTGAIMAVPAHDERDWDFAKKYGLPIREVVMPVRIDHTNPHVPGKKVIERKAIQAIVRNTKTGKILCLKWKKQPWTTFIVGGIEGNEDIVEAARREVLEETGYKNLKYVRTLGGTVKSEFFAAHKDENRVAYFNVVYFELENEDANEISVEEKEKHEPIWLDIKDIRSDTMQCGELDIWLHRLQSGNDASTEDGLMINSGNYNGKNSELIKKEITESVGGKWVTTFKLRDWVFSRQRYWGEPIPVIHCDNCALKNPSGQGMIPVPEKDLPVLLPNVKSYKPTDNGESPLSAISSWVNVKCPVCKGRAKRETDVMPNWAGSSWYFLRYADTKNKKTFASKQALKYWTPVDWYNGGMEHTTLHLLYSRFWHKFLYDLKLVPTKEPYSKRTSHGLILAGGGVKMSKSLGNVVNPDSIVRLLGADTLRHYEMFMGPFDQSIAWNGDAIAGSRRFLERVFKLFEKVEKTKPVKKQPNNQNLDLILNQTIKKVTDDIEELKMNTALSQMMILLNEFEKEEKISKNDYGIYLKLLAPFTPHMAEELWIALGEKSSIHLEAWPKFDSKNLFSDNIKLPVQINGKVRATIEVKRDTSEDDLQKMALAHPDILKFISGKNIKRVIYVKNRVMNIVL